MVWYDMEANVPQSVGKVKLGWCLGRFVFVFAGILLGFFDFASLSLSLSSRRELPCVVN